MFVWPSTPRVDPYGYQMVEENRLAQSCMEAKGYKLVPALRSNYPTFGRNRMPGAIRSSTRAATIPTPPAPRRSPRRAGRPSRRPRACLSTVDAQLDVELQEAARLQRPHESSCALPCARACARAACRSCRSRACRAACAPAGPDRPPARLAMNFALAVAPGRGCPAASRRRAPSWNMSATGGLTSFIGLDEPAGSRWRGARTCFPAGVSRRYASSAARSSSRVEARAMRDQARPVAPASRGRAPARAAG